MNQKHISMELTADGARVTNLKMDGGKLILTIEAQLADSQLTASDVDGSVEALAASLLPSVEESPSSPAQPANRPTPDTGIFTLKQPAQPAPASAELPSSPFSPPPGTPPMFAETPVDPARPTRPVEQPKSISFGGDPLPAPASPDLGISMGSGIAPGIGMEQPVFEQESVNPFAASAFETETFAPAPGAPAAGLSLGSDLLAFSAPAPQPQFQQPAPAPAAPALDLSNPFAPPPSGLSPLGGMGMPSLAVSDESNIFGGARHGEPQPAISFGQDLLGLGQPAAPAAPQPAFAPGAGLNLAPEPAPSFGLGATPGLSLGAALPPQQPAPAAPQPMIMPDFGLAPAPAAAAPGFGAGISFEAPAPAAAPAPAPDLTPPQQPQQNAFGFAAQPEPQPAPAPVPMPAPQPAQAAQPAPTPAPAPAPEEKPRPEAGGTTVLIRYTCPKCKTQGMQAVDKVGTVVNCSNCGKAMRLVMKK